MTPSPRPTSEILATETLLGGGDPVRAALGRGLGALLGIDRLNALSAALPELEQPHDFFARTLEVLGVQLDHAPTDLAHVPANGPCVIVANHPRGMIDGIALGALLATRRSDFLFLGNLMLDRIPGMRPFNIAVDPFGGPGARARNVAGMRRALEHVRAGHALVLFPAGEVAHLGWNGRIEESIWQPNLARLLRRAGAPVVPMWIDGTNSATFHALGLLHPLLRTARLPLELLRLKGRTVRIEVGRPLGTERWHALPEDALLMSGLREHALSLATPHRAAARTTTLAPTVRTVSVEPDETFEPIVEPTPVADLLADLAALPAECLLVESGELQVFATSAERIPHLLREIGRQREIAFREVGEGTGRAIDLDEFDPDYDHLFLWNRARHELLGAYRIGRVDAIVARRGVAGLYTSTLFEFDAAFLERIGPMLELGRSFVRTDQQRSFGALYLLWRGIGTYCAQRPRYRWLFGAVSISDEYSTMSKRLLTAFVTHHHIDETLAAFVTPRNPAEDLGSEATEPVADLEALSRRVTELEGGQRDVPVLLKQYLKLGARVLGVNRDPRFRDVLDALILVDLVEGPQRLLEKYLGKDGLRAVREYHETRDLARR